MIKDDAMNSISATTMSAEGHLPERYVSLLGHATDIAQAAALLGVWLVSLAFGVVWLLLCLIKPEGWGTIGRRLLALGNIAAAAMLIYLAARSTEPGSFEEFALPIALSLSLAGFLAVPTLSPRSRSHAPKTPSRIDG